MPCVHHDCPSLKSLRRWHGYCLTSINMRVVILTIMMCILVNTRLCAAPKQAHDDTGRFGGTLVWGTFHKPSALNPFVTISGISVPLFDLIFNRLVRVNARDEIEPDLAYSWNVSADGLVYTFYLRKGVKFHDGKECTSEDVKFTYDMVVDQKNDSVYRLYFDNVDEFQASGRYTFRVVLHKPSVFFIQSLVLPILPKHHFKDGRIRNSLFEHYPVGTGAFKFKEWIGDDRIILEYNQDYYEGRPYLDRIMVKVYPDAESLWAAFMRQEVDMDLFIEQTNYEIVKDDPAFKTYAFAFDCYYALMFNMSDSVLQDKTVRYAIALAIDKKELIRYVAKNYGIECQGPFSRQALGAGTGCSDEYDPDRARALLESAGWKDIDNDLILEKGSEELELKILVDSRNDIYRKISQVLHQQLQEIGVRIHAQLFNDEAMLTKDFLRVHKPQSWLGILNAGTDIFDHLVIEYWSSAYRDGSRALWNYDNKAVTDLFKWAELTPHKEERSRIYRKIDRCIHDDRPACFLFVPMVLHAISCRIENSDDFFTSAMPVYTIKDWYYNNTTKGGEKNGGN